MEVETLDDDVFFAELSNRVSLLITDDEEEESGFGTSRFPAAAAMAVVAPLGFSQGASTLAPPAYYTLFHHAAARYGAGDVRDNGGRGWHWQLQCGSKGTGVFIPRSTATASPHSKKKGRKWSDSENAAAARAQVEAAGAPTKRRS